MPKLPSTAAIGKAVSLRMHDGRVLHGVLDGTTATFYILAQGERTVRIRRNLVNTLVVRERVS